jgi:sialate O-acetylesterase
MTTNLKFKFILILGIILNSSVMFSTAKAEIKLPTVISSNMVLQREIPINIWGWAKPGEKVSIQFNGQKLNTKASQDSTWKIVLKPMAAGGPYELVISGNNSITLNNILIGDVWLCGGQSNMEFSMNQLNKSADEIAAANQPKIRLFVVPKRISEKPLDNTLPSEWTACNPKTVATFSAVGYFFATNLQKTIDVPIGLINCNWGGTDVETWTDIHTMYGFPEYRKSLEELKTKNFSEQMKDMDKLQEEWNHKINSEDIGTKESWFKPETKFIEWKEMKIPGYWETQGLKDVDGVVWFKTEFDLTADEAKAGITLNLGRIDDGDKTFVNGQVVGETPNQYDKIRSYQVAPSVLAPGKNLLVVKVIDFGWGGGFYGPDDDVYFSVNNVKKLLAGNWQYKVGISLPSPFTANNPNLYPSLLYNGMVNPIVQFGIKGAIWYQGENNVSNAFKYRDLLSAMIGCWRKNWDEGNFPFLIVQLANFDSKGSSNEGDWAMLRESQSIVASTVTNCGMATIIDIGESHNIHPKNKQEVGERLSLAALNVAYKQNIECSGPVYESMTIDKNKIIVGFTHADSGFVIKNKHGYINGFAIAGTDKEFHPARAYLENNKIIVECDSVANPVAVRYAWQNDPNNVNLYNKEGLPAVPFRSDSW